MFFLSGCLLVSPLWSHYKMLCDETPVNSCDHDLETTGKWSWQLLCDEFPSDITMKLSDDLSESNGHGDLTVASKMKLTWGSPCGFLVTSLTWISCDRDMQTPLWSNLDTCFVTSARVTSQWSYMLTCQKAMVMVTSQ